ncbi:exocyst complex component 3-like protein 4 isoform 1-T3 [Polymixia lowei]
MASMEESADTEGVNSVQDDDRVSVKSSAESNGKTQSNGAVKEKPGMLKTFRDSIRRAGVKSPLSPNSKGSKVTPVSDTGKPNDDPGTLAASPGLGASSPVTSPVTSPLKTIGGLFQKKEENNTNSSPPATKKPLSHSRTRSDPTAAFGDSLMKKGASLRRSLRDWSKVNQKTPKQESLIPVSEVTVEEKKEEEIEWEEIEESYTLPEIPPTPLSVMQINKLIEMEVLEEAHLNLLSLRQEFQQEQRSEEVSSSELAKKEKDLSLLYANLREKVKTIVRDSSSLPSRNKGLLVHVARIIQEEEKRRGDPGSVAGSGSWREAWREAVNEGVQAKLGSVHLDRREQNASWLAVHLGLLGKAIVEDLESVKRDLRWSYPPSFNVFSSYVRCYDGAVGQHLKKLQQQATDLREYYALLDWIINKYQSERIMGSPTLRPEMESESPALSLEDGFVEQLKGKYCSQVQEDMRSSLDKMLQIECDLWSKRMSPEMDEEFLNSEIHYDIWTRVKSNVLTSRALDAHLELKVTCSCLEELKQFPKRFETEFRRYCSCAEIAPPLWHEYQITYINSFAALKQHMEDYRSSCPAQEEHFSREVNSLIQRLVQGLEDQYKNDSKPYLRRMMTRKWLTSDDDFRQLHSQTEHLSKHCALMRPPHAQAFASGLHYYMAKEYVSQLMKNNYSCKNRKHEKAARKIREQWAELRELFEDMKSTHDWLHPVGDQLSDIIGQKNKRHIKNHLQPLVEHYPDISKKHLAAVLYFRGLTRGRERQLILQRLMQLKRTAKAVGDNSRPLFGAMPVTVNTDCLADIPFSCLAFLLPDN